MEGGKDGISMKTYCLRTQVTQIHSVLPQLAQLTIKTVCLQFSENVGGILRGIDSCDIRYKYKCNNRIGICRRYYEDCIKSVSEKFRLASTELNLDVL